MLLAAFALTFVSLNASSQNLVLNPGFETTLAPWWIDNWAQNVVSATRITDNPHSGNYCVKVEMSTVVNSPNMMYFYPNLHVQQGQALEIRFWARGVSNGAVLNLLLRKGGAPHTTYYRIETGLTDDWQEYVYTAVLPTGIDTSDLTLRFMLTAKGFVCLDDVSVTPMPASAGGPMPVLNPVRNPSFEAGKDGWSATFRQNEFGGSSKESGSIAPVAESSALYIKSDTGLAHGQKYLSFTNPSGTRTVLTSSYVPARYGHPLYLKFSLRASGAYGFSAGINSGKNASIRLVSSNQTSTTQWKQFTIPFTLQPAPNGVYHVMFQFNSAGRFDIDAVSIVEQAQASPILYPVSTSIEAVDTTHKGNLYYAQDTAAFRLNIANGTASTTTSYRLSVKDYLDGNIKDTTVSVTLDGSGYGNAMFYAPTGKKGGFRIEARILDSTNILAEQLYCILPVLPQPSERPDSYFGGHVNLTSYNLEIARKAGIRWLRLYPPLTTLWMAMETSAGVWHYDTAGVAYAHAQGFHILSGFNTAPDFEAAIDSTSGVQNRWATAFPPKSLPAWKQYVAKCYNAFHPYIDAWELWNEPDGGYMQVKKGWKKDSVYYALLKATREVFDSTGQPVLLMGAAQASISDSLGWKVLLQGGDTLLNAYSYHHYSLGVGGNNPDQSFLMPKIADLRARQNITGDSLPIWITEAGLTAGQSVLSTYNVPASSPVTPSQAAASVIRSTVFYKAMKAKRYFQYHVFATPSGRRIYQDATEPFTDVTGCGTPTLAAHAAMVAFLEDAAPLGFEQIPSTTVKAAHFASASQWIDVYWAGTSTAVTSVAGLQAGDEVYDMMGNLTDPETTNLNEYPVYVVRSSAPSARLLTLKKEKNELKNKGKSSKK